MPGFDALAAKLAALPGIHERIAPSVADDFTEEIRQEFVGESDPYGQGWKPLSPTTVRKKGHDRIMFESGEMLDRTTGRAIGPTIDFVGTDYGPIHQKDHQSRSGAPVPARPAIPNKDALPKQWQEAVRTQYRARLSKELGT